MSNSGSGWWSDLLIPLLVVSGVLFIFYDGLAMTIVLWIAYLLNGARTVKAIPSEENEAELFLHCIIGIIVVIISVVIRCLA